MMKGKFSHRFFSYLLITGLMLISAGVNAQQSGGVYPREALSSRLLKISKDYNTTIMYNPGTNDITVPELQASEDTLIGVLEQTLSSAPGTSYKVMDGTIVVKFDESAPSSTNPPSAPSATGK